VVVGACVVVGAAVVVVVGAWVVVVVATVVVVVLGAEVVLVLVVAATRAPSLGPHAAATTPRPTTTIATRLRQPIAPPPPFDGRDRRRTGGQGQ
jgi:hypothetical protein